MTACLQINLSGHKDVASRIDKAPACDHDPSRAAPFNRLHPSGAWHHFAERDLDCAAGALKEGNPAVDIADPPIRDQVRLSCPCGIFRLEPRWVSTRRRC